MSGGSVGFLTTGNPGAGAGDNGGAGQGDQVQQGQQGGQPAAGGDFLSHFKDSPELSEFVGKKGWKDASSLVNSYRELEKMIGGEKIPVPKDANDKAAWDVVLKRLGRPDAADGYGISKREGADPEFAKFAEGMFHEIGLPVHMAQAIADKFAKFGADSQAAQEERYAQSVAADLEELRSLNGWGPAYEAKSAAVHAAMDAFKIDSDTVTKIERSLGTKATANLFASIGEKMGEARQVTPEGTRSSSDAFMTPALALEKIRVLKSDRDWTAKYMAGDLSAVQELAQLQKIAGYA